MAFDYVVSLDLTNRPCLVAGDGPLAAERVAGLLASGAVVTLVTPHPAPDLVGAGVTHIARLAAPEDLDGMTLAIVTREDAADVARLYAAAEQRGVLFAALDDVDHCHFGAVSTIRRGPVTVTISTAGRAPALSRRLRLHLEAQLGPEVGDLADALHEARRLVLPRTVPFDDWAARWTEALADLDHLLALQRAGRTDLVIDHIHAHIAASGTPTVTHAPATIDNEDAA